MENNGEVDGRAVGGPFDTEMKRDPVTNLPYLSHLEARDLSFSPSFRPGLQHYSSAPIKYNDNILLCKDQDVALSRSNTDKREATKCDLMLDMLSEKEKKKIMEDLVKIQNNGTVEVNVAQSAPVATELLKLDAIDFSYSEFEDDIFGFNKSIPKLKIAMLVVGTRGDIQPFIAFAKRLQACAKY
ncbi:hypothetical protein IEQ34_002470 [Dendrobium chrysotoxum]|uniref:Glycosyltransferase family 28 N-terminal domain-containing protein n=1 Tax=Dendrobium chrysotoxum TaxID=161865 RepID=A0AAV7HNJ4_DENCH|nr:hypothetical protein IEQ34_002470 [Dendrobium chrysotoxum]